MNYSERSITAKAAEWPAIEIARSV
jgi:hypothetical protein